jgi:hypothetical protein
MAEYLTSFTTPALIQHSPRLPMCISFSPLLGPPLLSSPCCCSMQHWRNDFIFALWGSLYLLRWECSLANFLLLWEHIRPASGARYSLYGTGTLLVDILVGDKLGIVGFSDRGKGGLGNNISIVS